MKESDEIVKRWYVDGKDLQGHPLRLSVGVTAGGGVVLVCPGEHQVVVNQQAGLDLSTVIRRAVTDASTRG